MNQYKLLVYWSNSNMWGFFHQPYMKHDLTVKSCLSVELIKGKLMLKCVETQSRLHEHYLLLIFMISIWMREHN